MNIITYHIVIRFTMIINFFIHHFLVGKARECKVEADCTAIQNTTCMVDPRDSRTRCLCGDYTAPINALCTNKYKGINREIMFTYL